METQVIFCDYQTKSRELKRVQKFNEANAKLPFVKL